MIDAVFAIPGDIALPTGGYTYDRRVLALFERHGVRAGHVALAGSFPSPSADDLVATERLLAATPPGAVLLIDGLALGAMPPALIRRVGRPLVALVHHPLGLEAGLTPARARELVASETAALAVAQCVIATSTTTARTLVADFAVPPGRIVVAEPGTDAAPSARGTGHPLQLLAVGSVVPRKGYDVLVRALDTLPAGVDWRIDIAGARDRSPATDAALAAQIAASPFAARIRLLGAVDDARLAALYDAADLFVMPSLFEGYGMVLAEAMARGLPIVCTTGGAAAETAPDSAAIKVAPGDAMALASALAAMLNDDARRRRMADAAWLTGQSLPRWDDTTRIIADALRAASRGTS